jgi:hypothetical protein
MEFHSHFDNTVVHGILQEMVEGNGPINYPWKMVPGFIAYAQTFERFEAFKLQMALPHHVRIAYDQQSLQYRKDCDNGWQNPFLRNNIYHPVEKALKNAIEAENNVDLFKNFRAIAVEYLEKQY